MAADPDLAALRPFLELLLETRAHRPAPEAEATLASLDEVLGLPSTVYSRTTGADARFAPVRDTDGRTVEVDPSSYHGRLATSPSAEVLAATFAAEVRKNVALARLRGYPSATAMLLAADRVSPDLYDQILDAVLTGVAPAGTEPLRRAVSYVAGLVEELEAALGPA